MDISEKELEDMIWSACSSKEGRESLHERGLPVKGTAFRQVNIGRYGIADLLTVSIDRRHYPTSPRVCRVGVYELKKGEVGIEALGQAIRYKEGITHFLRQLNEDLIFSFTIHLIGSEINQSRDFLSLSKEVSKSDEISPSGIHIYQYSLSLDGLNFNPSNANDYHIAIPGHPSSNLLSYSTRSSVYRGMLTC